jgi:hypothetical protein
MRVVTGGGPSPKAMSRRRVFCFKPDEVMSCFNDWRWELP